MNVNTRLIIELVVNHTTLALSDLQALNKASNRTFKIIRDKIDEHVAFNRSLLDMTNEFRGEDFVSKKFVASATNWSSSAILSINLTITLLIVENVQRMVWGELYVNIYPKCIWETSIQQAKDSSSLVS